MAAILRAVLSMSAATVLSRITGLARTLVQAATLGTGLVAGSYALSNTLPNQIYELFMGGVLSSVFVPLLVERLSRHGEEDARRLTDALLTVVVPFLALVAILGAVLAGPIVELTTDWSGSENLSAQEAREKTELAVLFFRLFALQILLYGLGAIATGVLNSHRRFFLPTFAPVLNNLIVMASFALYAFVAPEYPTAAVYALALGTTLGVAVMSLVLFPAVYALGYRPRPRLGHPALKIAAGLIGPAVVFVAAAVGVQVIANYLGSRYDGVEELWYAFTIFSLPYGVFVVSVSTALAPELSERFARGDTDGYRETLSFGLRTTAFVVVPASVGMASLSDPVVGLLLERGSFDERDTQSVANLLALYAAGLLGYAAYSVLIRAFYSRQNTRSPALLNVGLLVLYTGLAYGLSGILGLPGVALAFSLAYAVLALLCLWVTRSELKRLDGRRLLRALLKILAAGAAMYAVAWSGIAFLGTGSGSLNRVVILAAIGATSLGAYLAMALLLKMEELRSAAVLLKGRRSKSES